MKWNTHCTNSIENKTNTRLIFANVETQNWMIQLRQNKCKNIQANVANFQWKKKLSQKDPNKQRNQCSKQEEDGSIDKMKIPLKQQNTQEDQEKISIMISKWDWQQ